MSKKVQQGALYQQFLEDSRLLAILVDPDKTSPSEAKTLIERLPRQATHIFVGGSTVKQGVTESLVLQLKQFTELPIILFPGDATQITNAADGLLFLSLLSGRNPEFLIEQHIKAVPRLKQTTLEIIPTAYILIDGGVKTAVQRVTNTIPMPQENIEGIVNTALAAQFSGKKLIYLEAGSGAQKPVSQDIIKEVSKNVSLPIIVGGGITTEATIQQAFSSGSKMVVIGTAFEKNTIVFN